MILLIVARPLSIHICKSMYKNAYADIGVYSMYIHMYLHMSMYMFIFSYTCIFAYTHMYMYICTIYVQICVYAYAFVDVTCHGPSVSPPGRGGGLPGRASLGRHWLRARTPARGTWEEELLRTLQ